MLKLEELQKKYSQYEDKNSQSNLQKAKVTYAKALMNLSLAEYQDKFCRKYTHENHQAMIFQQQEVCERLESSILD
ncbi:hypothetical protein [Candidatus Tisiphia endosymbiont of Nemotelus uliginosus]|uniref:hypothetical protein n=1 Tax=Candidatus Tisiphia endosymbiont of Nemotelus uliginosus TaxID=3077926 RepID=UPI0035C8887E